MKHFRPVALLSMSLLLPLAIGVDSAMALSSYLTGSGGFNVVYPASQSGTNASCNICHSSGGGTDLNGYGKDWAQQHNTGLTTVQAFRAIETMNSDGASLANLQEINASAQPGWTTGANNQLYDIFALNPTRLASAPAITGNLLDPAAANQAPVLAPIANQTATEGVLKTISISATDDGPLTALIFSSGSLPTGATLTDNHNGTATFSWTPSFTQGSTTPYPVTITVADAGSLTASQTFTITVGNVNQPPVLSPSPVGNRTVNEGQLLTIAFSATDPDGGTLTFSSSALPTGASLVPGANNTATFSWTPSFTQAGNYSVTVTVTDTGGLTDSETFTITVGNVSQPPVLSPSPVGNRTVNEGQLLTIAFSATDPDGGTLTFSSSALPTGASLVPGANNTATFSWTPSFTQAGNYSVTVTVTDTGGLTDSETFTITVGNVNRPPTVTNPGNQAATTGQLLTIAFNGSDPDGDLLTFSSSALPTGASLVPGANNTATFSWTPTTAQASATPYSVTITVTDPGGLTASQSFTITVTAPTAVNHAPTVTNPGNKTVTAGQLLAFSITGSDPDGNTLTFSAGTTLPSGATLSPSGAFAWTPTTAQASATPYSVTVTATDNGTPPLTSTPVTFTITVNAATVANRPPVLTNPGNKTVNEGQLLSFTLQATDPDGNGLSFSAGTTLPSGAVLTQGGAFSWTPTVGQAGSYQVTVTVTDNGSPALSASQTFTITVLAVVQTPPPSTGLDFGIARFSATEEITLRSRTPVTFQLVVKNVGTISGSAPVTLVGSQNGVEVYRRTMEISGAAGTTTTLGFLPYTPTSAGTIRWTATIQDPVPGNNTATASTEVERNGEIRSSSGRRRSSD